METIIEEKIEIAPELLQQIKVDVEKQVIIHGTIYGDNRGVFSARLWPTIYIIPQGTNDRYKLLHHFNIALYPQWQPIQPGKTLRFTLIFEGLPANCTNFDLLEIIDEPRGFEVRNINRNKEDVYFVVI